MNTLLASLRLNFRPNFFWATAVAGLLFPSGVLFYRTLRPMVTGPLDELVRTAKAVEVKQYQAWTLRKARTDQVPKTAGHPLPYSQ